MRIENVLVYTEEKTFCPGSVWIEGKKIRKVLCKSGKSMEPEENGEVYDGGGKYLIPGMIDLHLHACLEHDFSDGTVEAVEAIARFELQQGVTSICPATMTLPMERLEKILKAGAAYKRLQDKQREEQILETEPAATLVGINMEGPFISREKCGAQDPNYIQKPSMEALRKFLEWSEGLVKIVGVAPEQEGAIAFISEARESVKVAIAHSNATYEQAVAGIKAGASHGTHLFNGMTPLGHREPGIPGAVLLDKSGTAELICDGVHLHPALVKLAAGILGSERTVFVSDSIRGTGFGDGRYLIGDLEFEVTGNRAVLVEKGALAGSVTPLPACMRLAVQEMGVPLETAVAAVTCNPAKVLGLEKERGFLKEGCFADMVLLDGDLRVRQVWKEGVPL